MCVCFYFHRIWKMRYTYHVYVFFIYIFFCFRVSSFSVEKDRPITGRKEDFRIRTVSWLRHDCGVSGRARKSVTYHKCIPYFFYIIHTFKHNINNDRNQQNTKNIIGYLTLWGDSGNFLLYYVSHLFIGECLRKLGKLEFGKEVLYLCK